MLDPALDTLLLPFETGALAWPAAGLVLFQRARMGAALSIAPKARLLCRQGFRPFAEALTAAGFHVDNGATAQRFSLILLLPSRQREEARFHLADAVERAEPGALVVAAIANNEGAK